MHMRYALLALLVDGEAHGYQLLKQFHRRIGPFWHPNIGQVCRRPVRPGLFRLVLTFC